MKKNPTEIALEERGINLPEVPLDLSRIFESCGIRRSYIIGMTGRCGSTWLTSALGKIDGAGNPREIFSEAGFRHFGKSCHSNNFADLVESMVNELKDGDVFGFKIDPKRIKWLGSLIDWEATFPPGSTAWIDMRRINIVKQAFSFATAKQTGFWHNIEGKASEKDVVPEKIEESEVWRMIFSIVRDETYLNALYERSGISPLRLKYEELSDSKDQVVVRALNEIDPDFDWVLDDFISGATEKLDRKAQSVPQRDFVQAYASELNYISRMRGNYDAGEFKSHFENFPFISLR